MHNPCLLAKNGICGMGAEFQDPIFKNPGLEVGMHAIQNKVFPDHNKGLVIGKKDLQKLINFFVATLSCNFSGTGLDVFLKLTLKV